MSVKIVRKKLKNSLPFADVRDPQLKDALMKIGENFSAIQSQLENVQRAAVELQRPGGSAGGESPEMSAVMNAIYPVGSVYIGTQTECPIAAFVGIWEEVEGRYLLASGDLAETEGSESFAAGSVVASGLPKVDGKFTITPANLRRSTAETAVGGVFSANGGTDELNGKGLGTGSAWQGDGFSNVEITLSAFGGSKTVRPPAFVVNVWKRTS